uniref:Kringle domain-containing protein n=1 Tax=Callorhinchus milii TaxID=7868 RepID=A0A4W3H440_CALMI
KVWLVNYNNHVILRICFSENYCRNPDQSSKPWCYTTNPSTRWNYCPIPKLEENCYFGTGFAYRGTVHNSQTGKTCQSWDSQEPHKHTKTAKNYPNGDLKHNYCRNPNCEKYPWCYTTDPESQWEYFHVLHSIMPRQILNTQCFTGSGAAYKGTVSKTVSGKTCQRWDSQEPHEHTRTPGQYLDK